MTAMNKHMYGVLALLSTCALMFAGCAFADKLLPVAIDGDKDADDTAVGDAAEEETSGETQEEETEAQRTLITVAPPPSWNPAEGRTPRYIHMTYQNRPDSAITLQWQTEEKDETVYIPKVWVVRASDVPGADPTTFEQEVVMPYDPTLIAQGWGERYSQELLYSPERLFGLHWTVEITLPQPDADYYYRVGTWESFDQETGEFTGADLSPVYRFRSGLPKGSSLPFTFGFGSDSQNWKEDLLDTVTHIRSNNGKDVRFWLFGGDLTEVGTQSSQWNWFDTMAPILHYLPVLPVKGNHDLFEGVFYGEFSLPYHAELPEEFDRFAYSFDYGNAHFLGFYSNGESMVEQQLDFISKDLAKASQDSDIKWIVAYYHHPAYSSSSVHGSTDFIQSLVVPLFDRYHVDLSFSGHDHDYERTKPLKGGEIVQPGEGTVYIVSGGFFSKKSYGNGTSDFTQVSFDGETKSYVVLTIDGDTLSGVAYAGNHDVLDTFTLKK